jgi:phosphoribosylaminoimidazolecarboxamide formyltransferase / IMP cyclohydrolase
MKNIAVFVSGEGTNLQAIIDAVNFGEINGIIKFVLSNKEDVGALTRAQGNDIPTHVLSPKKFKDSKEFNFQLLKLCQKNKIDLICLAGYLLKIEEPLLSEYQGRIINIHPALLPDFGGDRMYGIKVHEAVLKAKVKSSGATVHFVDGKYDNGPIIMKAEVPVFEEDTPKTLSKRVREQEHIIYPKVVKLFCEDKISLKANKATIKEFDNKVKRVLISVSDKTGVVSFAKELSELGIEIISTSGTAKLLSDNKIPVTLLEDETDFPEILHGRVKTLHPVVHGGILFKRDSKKHLGNIEKHNIKPIDMVVVNLYPFLETAKTVKDPFSDRLIEQIDIGGVALIRAAAKNHNFVTVLTSSHDYLKVLNELKDNKLVVSKELRRELAVKAFKHTAKYDSAIYRTLSSDGDILPEEVNLNFTKIQDLRYGENPHQRAAIYSQSGEFSFEKVQGKELSYNNILDVNGAHAAVSEFKEPAAVVFKHVTPCGVGTGKNLHEAFLNAWQGDPLSAFGGILAFNGEVGEDIAKELSDKFVEVIIAPKYSKEALGVFSKKSKLRLLIKEDTVDNRVDFKTVGDELLALERDRVLFGDEWETVTKRKPTKEEEAALKFSWAVCKHVKSNAIVFSSKDRTLGIGAGQMSRVDAVTMAGIKYKEFLSRNEKKILSVVMASDAFFPFSDGLEKAIECGISAVIQPGGSIRDKEVIECADKHDIAMVFSRIRHFKH